jgi:ubiquinone/menaquinone biosynthesis C-methylase UbiE
LKLFLYTNEIMTIIKAYLTQTLRFLKIIYLIDKIRFYFHKIKYYKKNNKFKKKNPDFVLPPDYLLYEAFRLDYEKYYESGLATAKWLKSIFEKYVELQNVRILDWGCGPARIVRHFPNVLGNNIFFATDYNSETIKWCRENIKAVEFNHNSLEAILPYEDNYFDIIYGLSIFTHLSESKHYEWARELLRILKRQGIFVFSTQGKIYLPKLTSKEQKQFRDGKLVVRSSEYEGHRVFSSFQPPEFIRKLFANEEIIEHIEPPATKENPYPQDLWIVRKISGSQ